MALPVLRMREDSAWLLSAGAYGYDCEAGQGHRGLPAYRQPYRV